MTNNVEQLDHFRSKEDREAVEARHADAEKEKKVIPETKVKNEHLDYGRHVASALDGQLIDVGYVDSRALFAHHEAVTADSHFRTVEVIHGHIEDDDHKTATAVAEDRISQTASETEAMLTAKKEDEENDVFGRALREFTTDHGSESVLRLKSIPDWSLSQANADEMNQAIKSNLAFVVPKELVQEIKDTIEYYSSMDVSNSGERTKGTVVTNRARGGNKESDMYTTLPITVDGKTLQMYFIYAEVKITEDKSQNSEETVTNNLESLAEEVGYTVVDVLSQSPEKQAEFFWGIMEMMLREQGSITGETANSLIRAQLETLSVSGLDAAAIGIIEQTIVRMRPQLEGALIEDLTANNADGLWDGSNVKLDPRVIVEGDVQYVSQVRTHEEYHKDNNHHLPLHRDGEVASNESMAFKIGGILFSTKELVEAINTLDVDKGTFEKYTPNEYRRYADKLLRAAQALTKDRLEEIRYAINVSKDLTEIDDRADAKKDSQETAEVVALKDFQKNNASNTTQMEKGLADPRGVQNRKEALPEHSSTVEDLAA